MQHPKIPQYFSMRCVCIGDTFMPHGLQEWAIPGMGMFSEAYFIFSIGTGFLRSPIVSNVLAVWLPACKPSCIPEMERLSVRWQILQQPIFIGTSCLRCLTFMSDAD